MSHNYSDYTLQKSSEKANLYKYGDGITWSPELKRWLVTSPQFVRSVLLDANYRVPSYEVQPIMDRLGIDLEMQRKIREFLPLAWEGETHGKLRQQMLREISSHSPAALRLFEKVLEKRLSEFMQPGVTCCLVGDIFKPAIRQAGLRLANFPMPALDDMPEIETIPQLFDDGISLRHRMRIDRLIRELADMYPDEYSEDEILTSIAIIAVGANTLLGSVTESFLADIRDSNFKPFNQTKWNARLRATGLPLIERIAIEDATLGTAKIGAGDRLRLFIESEAYSFENAPQYTNIYFAVGPHKCLGMAYSWQIWNAFIKQISSIELEYSLGEMSYRQHDYVFNIINKMEINFHA
jgi:cytochrome P450